MSAGDLTVSWVVLTLGDRPDALRAALASILRQDRPGEVVVVLNGAGAEAVDLPAGIRTLSLERNVGVPAGRDAGVQASSGDIIAFLDDDAVLRSSASTSMVAGAFASRPELGALSFRIVDEHGSTARRHVPRIGRAGLATAGPVATFLGGACALRRTAYDDAGRYWGELFYAHEELDLSWRMHDAGWTVFYEPAIGVDHPRTPISRHGDGWHRTGRNRVLIARRNLPWPVAGVHVVLWLLIGLLRAPSLDCRRAYWRGWRDGWRCTVERRRMRWHTVVALARAGRPPLL